MEINEKMKQVFSKTLGINESIVTNNLTYNTIAEWDSITHMELVSVIEQEFNVSFDTDDVLGMNTFAEAINIVKRLKG